MSRNITAAQKRAWKFYKSDALAQTNKESMTAFCMAQKRQKQIFSRSKSRVETKFLGMFFKNVILFFHNAVEIF